MSRRGCCRLVLRGARARPDHFIPVTAALARGHALPASAVPPKP
ncbi:hypothetical protein ACFXPV_11255 [Streptomyces sp. NPDC059118]